MTIAKHASSGQVSTSSKERGDGGAVSSTGASSGGSFDESKESQMAVRLDGAVLMAVKDAKDRDLRGYEREEYVVLRGQQAANELARLAGAGAGIVSQFFGQLPLKAE